MTGKMLDVAHLYPLELNLYGDRGNLIALERRAAWRGIQLRVHPVGGGAADLAAYDLVFIGGGQDREQGYVAEDLLSNKAVALRTAVAEGVPLLAVCGGYQLLGRYYRTADGRELPGVGLFDAWTEAGRTRLVGNAAVVSELEGLETLLVGFENHAGRTFLGPASRPLGRVVRGFGNNGRDGTEGAVTGSAVGTYLHGSLLPKNPALTDWLLRRALARRYGAGALRAWQELDDRLEAAARAVLLRRLRLRSGEPARTDRVLRPSRPSPRAGWRSWLSRGSRKGQGSADRIL